MTTANRGVLDEPPPLPMKRFTVDEYHRLGEAGVLTEDDRVELLGGWLVKKKIHNPLHDSTVAKVNRTLGAVVPTGWHIRVQSAVTTSESEPEPDLALVRGAEEDYARRHPGPGDVALLVEVADTSLRSDRGLKGSLYAEAGVACYWIVNVAERLVEVYATPAPGADGTAAYTSRRDDRPGESVPLVIDGAKIATVSVDDVLIA